MENRWNDKKAQKEFEDGITFVDFRINRETHKLMARCDATELAGVVTRGEYQRALDAMQAVVDMMRERFESGLVAEAIKEIFNAEKKAKNN